jgi:hypothetical protein
MGRLLQRSRIINGGENALRKINDADVPEPDIKR